MCVADVYTSSDVVGGGWKCLLGCVLMCLFAIFVSFSYRKLVFFCRFFAIVTY